MSDSEDTRLGRMEHWFRNQPVFSVLILCSAVLIGTSEVMEKGSNLLVSLGLKQEKALQLADENAKGDFSRKVIELAYRRKFWTENYIARLERGRPQKELDYTWNKHLDAVADWSSELMVTTGAMNKFYKGTNKPDEFQNIHSQFADIEAKCIVPLRSFKPTDDTSARKAAIGAAKEAEDNLGFDLYCFALGVSDPNKANKESRQNGQLDQASACVVNPVNPAVDHCGN